MTVFHFISSEGYYGAEAMLVALARNLVRLGCNSVVGVFHDFRCRHTEVSDRARRDGLPVETIACRGRWDGNVVKQLRARLKQHRVDVLHTHGYKADFYGYLAAWPSRAALLATCHNWPSKQPLMRAYARLDWRLLRHFESVVAVSDSVAHILRESGMPARKMSTISNGVEVERFNGAAPALRSERTWETRPVVGFVGRLVECKGGPVLLEAAQKVTAVYPGSVFALVGEGPLREEWELMARRLGLWDNVVFLGRQEDMPAVYASMDLLVLPSHNEATPMCVLEAMAAGKPVIATRVGALTDLVIPGVTGLLIEAGDAAGLAGAILQLLHNPELAKQYGENGRRHVTRHFSAEVMAASYVERYRQILGAKSERGECFAHSMDRV